MPHSIIASSSFSDSAVGGAPAQTFSSRLGIIGFRVQGFILGFWGPMDDKLVMM